MHSHASRVDVSSVLENLAPTQLVKLRSLWSQLTGFDSCTNASLSCSRFLLTACRGNAILEARDNGGAYSSDGVGI